MTTYKAIIFDWDGTLADSSRQIFNAIHYALKQLNMKSPPQELIAKALGLPLAEACHLFFPNTTPQLLEEFIYHYRIDYFKKNNKTVLFEDVKQYLPLLAQQTILCIATGKSRLGLEKSLQDTQAKAMFTTTKTVDECTSKPSPQMIYSICDDIGVYPKDILMLGDTTFDLLTAKNAGAQAVALTTGVHDLTMLATVPHKATFNNFTEFYHWVTDKLN